MSKKLILVIGATGAQGLAVVDKLLAPAEDGSPSPYAVRALTRDPESWRAKELTAKGVECFKGRFDDMVAVFAALQGVYGAWVNTDGFTVGEPWEIWCGIRIFELAKQAGVRHYVWSNLETLSKLGGNPKYRCQHSEAKGRVGEWMEAQPSIVSDTEMSWSQVTTGPYMDMLFNYMFGPMGQRKDGTVVFAAPIGNGHVPMIALSDLGYFARYTFDNRAATSRADLKIATELVGWEHLRETFEKVTGKKAAVVNMEVADWLDLFANADRPVASEGTVGVDTISWRQNFSGWWSTWRDDVVKPDRDMEWIRRVNPKGHTLESWMRENNYGENLWSKGGLLKITEDGKSPARIPEKCKFLVDHSAPPPSRF